MFKKLLTSLMCACVFGYLAYVDVPQTPKNVMASPIKQVVAKPKFKKRTGRRVRDVKLYLQKEAFYCQLPNNQGRSSCQKIKSLVDTDSEISVTYYKAKGVFWGNVNVVRSVEQNGKLIISPHDSKTWLDKSYDINNSSSKLMLIVGFFATLASLFIKH